LAPPPPPKKVARRTCLISVKWYFAGRRSERGGFTVVLPRPDEVASCPVPLSIENIFGGAFRGPLPFREGPPTFLRSAVAGGGVLWLYFRPQRKTPSRPRVGGKNGAASSVLGVRGLVPRVELAVFWGRGGWGAVGPVIFPFNCYVSRKFWDGAARPRAVGLVRALHRLGFPARALPAGGLHGVG